MTFALICSQGVGIVFLAAGLFFLQGQIKDVQYAVWKLKRELQRGE